MQPHANGVVVTAVSGKVASRLVRGDIIQSVDRVPVTTPEQVFAGLTRAKAEKRPALLQVRRGNTTLFVAVEASE